MAAGVYLLEIDVGATLDVGVILSDDDDVPLDVSAWTGTGMVRSAFDEVSPLATLTVAPDVAVPGGLRISLSATATAALSTLFADNATARRDLLKAVWDILVTKGDGTKERILEGPCTISPSVTR